MVVKFYFDAQAKGIIAAGVLLAALGATVLCTSVQESKLVGFAAGGLVLVGLITIVMGLKTAATPKSERALDERIQGINEKAGYSAFWLVMVAITMLFWGNKWFAWGLDASDVYHYTLWVGFLGWVLLRWYYEKKGCK